MEKRKLDVKLTYRYEFTVSKPKNNAGDPVDMYRYDQCFPIKWDMVGREQIYWLITCVHYDSSANWKPTVARWASFGWEVK